MEGLRTCMRYIFILSVMIIAGVFATDWWFTPDGKLLNDTLVGVLIGAPIGWFGSCVAFYTTEKVGEMVKKRKAAEAANDGSETPSGTDH